MMSMRWGGQINQSDQKLSTFFEQAWSQFSSIGDLPSCERHYLIGNTVIQLLFRGEHMLEAVTPVIAHLEVASTTPGELTIAIWDSKSTGSRMAAPAWANDDYQARGEIKGTQLSERYRVAYHPGSGVLSMLDLAARKAILWINDHKQFPYYEKAAPFRTILHWWFTDAGMQLVHGAAIGTDLGSILLTGKGGSGKSTTALLGVSSGLNYLGDDYVLCEHGSQTPRVHSLYCSAKADTNALKILSHHKGGVYHSPQNAEEKTVLLLNPGYEQQLRNSMPLRAIVIPSITDEHTTAYHPISSAQAFLALAPTTVFQLPGAGQTAISFLRKLCTELPCYRLQISREKGDPVTSLKQLLSALSNA
ncbi:MAG: hypothetical protein ACWA5Q_04875 [bacterium]